MAHPRSPPANSACWGSMKNDQVQQFSAPAAQHGGRGWGPAAVLRRRRGEFLYFIIFHTSPTCAVVRRGSCDALWVTKEFPKDPKAIPEAH
eukprot:gene11903-biopygen1476